MEGISNYYNGKSGDVDHPNPISVRPASLRCLEFKLGLKIPTIQPSHSKIPKTMAPISKKIRMV